MTLKEMMMNLTPNALQVLRARYLKGNETPESRLRTVAGHVASCEKDSTYWSGVFYEMMESLEFLPNTPCIANAGRGDGGNLNACFVLPIEDTLTNADDSGIMDTARNTALIHQTGGGTGFDFSRIRAKGTPVASSNGTASGPVSFLRLFDAVTETIKQGGIRRGANMGILHVDHPDIREFITSKMTEQGLNNFNISVAITDEFMYRVQDREHEAVELWKLISHSAWTYGDPGLFFIDEANRTNPLMPNYPIRATNPCGEVPLPDNDACNLGSINLGLMVRPNGTFNYPRFIELIYSAIRFLDDVVEVNRVPVPAIRSFSLLTRRLGLGVMGWADFLNKMHIPYNSEAAIDWARTIGNLMQTHAEHATMRLAQEKGPYPLSRDGNRRNVATLCIAPTGSISTIAGCSAGIEPYFLPSVTRRVAIGELHEAYENADQPWFRTAMEIPPQWHIRHAATWQKYIDNGVSKTVNLPNDATPETVASTYMLAWAEKMKGVTVYRDGSRSQQVYTAQADPNCRSGVCDI